MSQQATGQVPARQVFAAIIGSGFSGLAAAIELRRAGIDDLVILERGDALGGTWRDNHYPGCACDVPSHLYSFSFAPNPEWSRTYSPWHEIRAYLEKVADDFHVRRHIELRREVAGATWDEMAARWRVQLAGGEELVARVVVMAIGALSNPAIPPLAGIERFRGAAFHSARWRHDVPLAGKKVVVLGTGASAIQFVPKIQPEVARLTLLQRTPPWILPREDRAYTVREKAVFRRVPGARSAYRQKLYWEHEARALAFVERPALMRWVAKQGKEHIARGIPDPRLRAMVTPTYQPGCKRILMSDDYYPALARPNVEVIAAGIRAVGETDVSLDDGRTVEADVLIYGTGFAVHDYTGRMRIVGRDGVDLGATWKRDGAQAYLGTMVAGFPNLFTMTGPNTGLGHNSMIVMIEGQARYLREVVELMRRQGAEAVEPRRDAQEAYNAWLRGKNASAIWATGCRSWYLDEKGRNTTIWPSFVTRFRARLARVDAADLVLHAPRPLRRSVRDRVEQKVAPALARLPAPVQRRISGGAPVAIDGDELLPEIQLILSLRERLAGPPLSTLPLDEARRRFRRDTILHRGPGVEVGGVRDLLVDGGAGPIPARLYTAPGGGVQPLLVYFHGGGFVLGDLDTHDAGCRLIARAARMHVLAVDYRLAPEHPFPAAYHDASAAFRWVARNAAALGADPTRIAVGGDSAGANLAAGVANAIDSRSMTTGRGASAIDSRSTAGADRTPVVDAGPAAQLLFYPVVDRTRSYRSLELFRSGFLLTADEIAWFNQQYVVAAGADPADPRVAPLHADVSQAPPAIVVTAAFDPLRDEGEAYAAKLRAAGRKVDLRRIQGQVHGFVNLAGVSRASRATVVELARAFRSLLDRAGDRPKTRDLPAVSAPL